MRSVKVAFRGEIKNPAAAGIRPRFRPYRFPTPETGFPASCRHERVCRSTPNATRPRPQNQRTVFSARDRKRSDGPEKGGQGAPVRRAALRRPIRLPPKRRNKNRTDPVINRNMERIPFRFFVKSKFIDHETDLADGVRTLSDAIARRAGQTRVPKPLRPLPAQAALVLERYAHHARGHRRTDGRLRTPVRLRRFLDPAFRAPARPRIPERRLFRTVPAYRPEGRRTGRHAVVV